MVKMREFKNTKYGTLKMDIIIFETYVPILFTCKNDMNENFLCVNCQNNERGRRWLFTKTNGKILIKLFENELTIREAFLQFPEFQLTLFDDGNGIVQDDSGKDWTEESEYLPKADVLLDADPGEFDEEIAYYRNKAKLEYSSAEYTDITDCINTVEEDVSQMIEEVSYSISELSLRVYTKEVLQILRDVDNMRIDTTIQTYPSKIEGAGS